LALKSSFYTPRKKPFHLVFRGPATLATTMERRLFHLGFAAISPKVSDVFYYNPDERTTSVHTN
jgi:hypothetical protein